MLIHSGCGWTISQQAFCAFQVIGRLHVLADLAARTLTPIARPMWWLDPRDEATFTIHDQFALGDDFIVAPVVERGLPPGTST